MKGGLDLTRRSERPAQPTHGAFLTDGSSPLILRRACVHSDCPWERPAMSRRASGTGR